MATEDIQTSSTTTSIGTDWGRNAGGTMRTIMATDNDNVTIQHQCNKGSDYSNVFALDNMTGSVDTISLGQIRHRVRRTGVTDNATQQVRIDRTGASSWWTGTQRNAVNTFYTQTVTAPSGGWDETKVNGARLQYYHQRGANTSANYLRQDYFRLRMTFTEPVSAGYSLLAYNLPYAAFGALPFLEDLAMFFREAKVKIMYSPEELRQIKERIKNPTYFDMRGVQCL